MFQILNETKKDVLKVLNCASHDFIGTSIDVNLNLFMSRMCNIQFSGYIITEILPPY